jgi:hypothetical protein
MWIFWWEVNLCRPVFYHLFIHVLPLEIQLFRGEDCDTINWFIHVLPLEIQLFRGEDCDTIIWISTKGTMTSDLNSLNTNQKRTQHTTLEIQGLNWDRHNNVVGFQSICPFCNICYNGYYFVSYTGNNSYKQMYYFIFKSLIHKQWPLTLTHWTQIKREHNIQP